MTQDTKTKLNKEMLLFISASPDMRGFRLGLTLVWYACRIWLTLTKLERSDSHLFPSDGTFTRICGLDRDTTWTSAIQVLPDDPRDLAFQNESTDGPPQHPHYLTTNYCEALNFLLSQFSPPYTT